MEFEIAEKRNDIQFEVAAVSFPAYEEYLDRARQIADYIASVEVSEDTIKDAKKTLADARKLTDRLNRLRIDMKKQILRDFTTVEDQIKEISGVVDTADAELRAKVRELDELEREVKKEQLKRLWDMRIQMYDDVCAVFPNDFDKWLQPSHLNKTCPISKSEKDMVKWMEGRQKNIEIAAKMGDEYLTEYGLRGDLGQAITAVKEKEAIKAGIVDYREPEEEKAVFEVIGTKDIKLTEVLLEENHIKYERK